MNLLADDIIVRKKNAIESVWLSQRLIMEVCEVSEEYLKKVRSKYKDSVRGTYLTATYLPNTGKAWRWAKVKNSFYYCIDNIPDRAPTHYRSLFGDTETLKKEWKNQTTNRNLTNLKKAFFGYIEEHYKEYLSCFDPKVLINNKTYPIAINEREDTPLSFELDLFETENTLVRNPEAIELSYDKMESVIYGHKMALQTRTATKAAHAFAPDGNSDFTPVIATTGEDNGEGA